MKWKFWVKKVFDLARRFQVDCRACAPLFIFLTHPYPAYMSESSLHTGCERMRPRGSGPLKKCYCTAALQRLAGVLQAWNLKTNWATYWIMHEQTASSWDKPGINVSPRNPWAKARKRRGQEGRRRQKKRGETVQRVKIRIKLEPNWAIEDQRARGQIWGSLQNCSDKSRGRRKMSGNDKCTAEACLSFRWPRIICFLLLT